MSSQTHSANSQKRGPIPRRPGRGVAGLLGSPRSSRSFLPRAVGQRPSGLLPAPPSGAGHCVRSTNPSAGRTAEGGLPADLRARPISGPRRGIARRRKRGPRTYVHAAPRAWGHMYVHGENEISWFPTSHEKYQWPTATHPPLRPLQTRPENHSPKMTLTVRHADSNNRDRQVI